MLRTFLILTLAAASVCAQCESGWSPFGQSCYSLLGNLRTFNVHRSDCENLGGRLVTISSSAENNLVNQLQGCTLGTCGTYIGLQRNSALQFTAWIDGTPFGGSAYSNWNTGEPTNASDENCVEMIYNTGKWNDISCTLGRLAICEKRQCEIGWSAFGQCCYLVLTIPRTYEIHRADCVNRGGQLVSFISFAENAFVLRRQQAAGCPYGSSYCNAFIGLRRNSAGDFQSWLDGTPFGAGFYTNWNAGEPDNVLNEDCVETTYATPPKWNDIPCNVPRMAVPPGHAHDDCAHNGANDDCVHNRIRNCAHCDRVNNRVHHDRVHYHTNCDPVHNNRVHNDAHNRAHYDCVNSRLHNDALSNRICNNAEYDRVNNRGRNNAYVYWAHNDVHRYMDRHGE